MIASYVGFGNPGDSFDFARFHVDIQGGEDVYPDWNGALITNTRQIAGSSNIVTQIMGHGPQQLTLSISFDTRDQYRRFRGMYGQVRTLSLLAGFTSYEGDIEHNFGRDYEHFHNTLLIDIANVQNRIGGEVECTATFQRPGVAGATW